MSAWPPIIFTEETAPLVIVKSKWFFNNGELAVNEKYEYVYKVEKYKDRHGYTVVKIIRDDTVSMTVDSGQDQAIRLYGRAGFEMG